MIAILAGLGIITGLMCFLNLMAYNVLQSYNDSLVEKMNNLSFADVMHKLVNSIILYAPEVMQTAGNIVTWLYEGMLVNILICLLRN